MGMVSPRMLLSARREAQPKSEHPMLEEWSKLKEQGKIHNPLLYRPINPALDIVISKYDDPFALDPRLIGTEYR